MALLTGINPFHISALNKNRDHTSDKFMISFLKSNGFKIAKLTQCSVSNNRTRIMENNIKYYHVLLVSQLVLRNECSWSVINDQYDYHGFLVNLLKPLEFVNRPIITSYLLFHKSINKMRIILIYNNKLDSTVNKEEWLILLNKLLNLLMMKTLIGFKF